MGIQKFAMASSAEYEDGVRTSLVEAKDLAAIVNLTHETNRCWPHPMIQSVRFLRGLVNLLDATEGAAFDIRSSSGSGKARQSPYSIRWSDHYSADLKAAMTRTNQSDVRAEHRLRVGRCTSLSVVGPGGRAQYLCARSNQALTKHCILAFRRKVPFVKAEMNLLNALLETDPVRQLMLTPRTPPVDGRSASPRYDQILSFVKAGHSEKEIADSLGLSHHTVHIYFKRIYRDYGATTRAELMSRFIAGPSMPARLPSGLPNPVALPIGMTSYA